MKPDTKKTVQPEQDEAPVEQNLPQTLPDDVPGAHVSLPLVIPPPQAVTTHPQFNRQLVVDVDFSVDNPITITHSYQSNLLFVSVINIDDSAEGEPYPTFSFPSENELLVTSFTARGRFRVYISVIPQ